jgi:ABC-type Fe3+-hydroxamate transport system substrate-binding protein
LSLFFNKEKEAISILDTIKRQYNCHASNLATTSKRPTIAWTSYQQGEWYMYREPYFQQLLKDAGKDHHTTSSQANTQPTPLLFVFRIKIGNTLSTSAIPS